MSEGHFEDSKQLLRHAIGSSGDVIEPGLAQQLGELAREWQAENKRPDMLKRITQAALVEIDSADHACISLVSNSRVQTAAATDEFVQRVDEHQNELDEGPCLDSLREQVTIRSDDMAKDLRWPQFAKFTVENGIRSMLSVQLFVQDDSLGALNLYAQAPDAFTAHDESVAMLLAVHAALAIASDAHESNLKVALESRDIIGQAKGILMERFKIDAVGAFDLLVVASQTTHRKLREVAGELADTGEWVS